MREVRKKDQPKESKAEGETDVNGNPRLKEPIKLVSTQIQPESKAYRVEVELPSRPRTADTENRLINMLVGDNEGTRCHKNMIFLCLGGQF